MLDVDGEINLKDERNVNLVKDTDIKYQDLPNVSSVEQAIDSVIECNSQYNCQVLRTVSFQIFIEN